MTGSVASASNNPDARVLVIAPNWLGDGIMAMPAIQAFRASLPQNAFLQILAKPGQFDLWDMQPAVNDVWKFPKHRFEKKTLCSILKRENFDLAVVIPNSFRSALYPRQAGIPIRRGTRNQWGRGWLINDPVSLDDLQHRHQQWETARLLLGDPLPASLPTPHLQVPEEALARIRQLLGSLPRPWLGLLPGAARGPSKQWPGDRFQAVARSWAGETGGGVCWLGTPGDSPLCEELNQPLGSQGLVLAGKTSLKEFAAAIAVLDVIAANDSGGMHLATAVGTPVVAVFGITDPDKTGPLSADARVIQHSAIRSRSVPRESAEARAALEAVSAAEVTEAVLAFLPRFHKES